ncbi:demethoxyubiquinone hydroxylase family protein [Alphaproteobacteria bacterium]|nr:demethoxyubiquinone hydroxylase family protein [Alphaproteobacteria bacterium]
MSSQLKEMLRVDHAGEYGAVRIYDGQVAVFKGRPDKQHLVDMISHMAEQEQTHLKKFDELLVEHDVRPTALAPLWNIAGFALGATTALMGERAAMACTAAVEEVIDAHYAEQIKDLESSSRHNKSEIIDTIKAFREDEIAHRDTALENGAEQAPAYTLLRAAIRFGCHTAIKISQKI